MNNLPDFISSLPTWIQWLLATLVLLATIGFSIKDIIQWIARWHVFKIWPHREGWSASCPENSKHLDVNLAWTGAGQRWSQMREMRIGDFFKLNLDKPRVISQIKLETEGPRYPKKYMLEVLPNRDSKWEDIGFYDTLDVKLPKLRRILGIRWTIIEPNKHIWPDTKFPVAWSIYDIRLTEVRLIGRWWHKVIDEK
jgi:hypothetical protein